METVCVDSDEIEVTAVSANANAGTNKTICNGESVQLSASGGVTYSWSPSTGLSDVGVELTNCISYDYYGLYSNRN